MESDLLNLVYNEKEFSCLRRIHSFHCRFPDILSRSSVKEAACFLSYLNADFVEAHSVGQLIRIFLSFHRLMHQQASKQGGLRTLSLSTSILGIVIHTPGSLFIEDSRKIPIMRSIQNLIPGLMVIPSSLIFFPYAQSWLSYLEIKKMRGGQLSKIRKKLEAELLFEIGKETTPSPQMVVLPGTEEEVFKNIHLLSRELKSTQELPQLIISCVAYDQEHLKFLVVALRVLKPNSRPWAALVEQLPSTFHFQLEQLYHTGLVRKKYQKEAAVFTLEVDNRPFSRKGSNINLRLVRKYVATTLEKILGSFRDYNGGLLHVENEQLLKTKRALEAQGIHCPELEFLFFNIKPIALRPMVTATIFIEMAKLFGTIKQMPLEKDSLYVLLTYRQKNFHLAFVKTLEKGWKKTFGASLFNETSQIGMTTIEREGYLYLCCFQLNPQSEFFFESINTHLEKHSRQGLLTTKKIININFQGGDPPSINPRLAADIHCHILSNLLFEGLTRIDVHGNIQPAAAERIILSSNQQHYTFHLRKNYWSHGEEVTAFHFEKAWKKTLTSTIPGYPCSPFFYPIQNVREVIEQGLAIDEIGIRCSDSMTLHVTLERPCPHFLNLLATPPFFPLWDETEEPTEYNGPFVLTEWKRGISLLLLQNPFYQNSKTQGLNGVRILMIKDPYLAYEMFQKKELDLIGDPISPLSPEILNLPNIRDSVIHKPISRIFWIHCNHKTWPLNNRSLRRALNLAINRKKLVESVFLFQTPHSSPLPPRYSQCESSVEGNRSMAQSLFQQALSQLQLSHKAFPKLVLNYSSLAFEESLYWELKTQWEEVLGITIQPRPLPWDEFSASVEKSDFQLAGLFRRDFYNNVLFYLSFFYNYPNNPHSLDSKAYAQLFELYFKNPSQQTLKALEELLIEESPIIPLVSQNFLTLQSDRLQGVHWQENGCMDLSEVTL